MKEVAIGIDMGGTNTIFSVVDKYGKTLAENSLPTNTFNDIDSFIEALDDKIQFVLTEFDGDINLKGIGIGAPNGNFYRGTIEHAPNLKWKGVIPFVDLLKKYYRHIPIILTNDANAAALGELVYGGGQDMTNFVAVTLGTGLGSGLIFGKELYYGNDGFAGELGHIIVEKHGRKCGCGRRGCLETYVSAQGIKRTAFELLGDENEESELRSIPFERMTAKDVTDYAIQGDKIAQRAFEITGEYFGRALADTVAVLNPEAIFLFGGLINSGELLFKPTQKHFDNNTLEIFKNTAKIIPSALQLQGKNIATLGASALIWKELEHKTADVL